ncbi:hypothetical protein ACFL47_08285 [Candidatus Latescibacterota bacterium]
MATIDNILKELDETYITQNVTRKHDEARLQYRLNSITVTSDTEFDDIIADYYNSHFSQAIATGTQLPRSEAAGRAKEIIEREYQRKGRDRLSAYDDAKTGNNGGMRFILDIIMEHMKAEAVERHIRDVIDCYVAPSNFNEQVEVIRQMITRFGSSLHLDPSYPERYARNYDELIRGLSDSFNIQASKFRRL